MKIKNLITKIGLTGLLIYMAMPMMVDAAGSLSNRSANISTSAAAATGVTYTVKFNAGTAGNVGSVKFEICDSPLETVGCAGTGDSSGASLAAGGLTGGFAGTNWSTPTWTKGAQTGPGASGTSVKFAASAQTSVSTSDQATVTLTNVVNPTASNKEFYLRITTYSDTGYVTEDDYGAVALDTANQITVSGTMPESLVFCVGTSGTDCSNITGTSVNLGTFSPVGTNTGTSLMSASTNAAFGYAITVNGTTLTSGSNTIPAMGTQTLNSAGCSPSCSSTTGVSQFGSNVKLNTVPSVGANVSGAGTAAGSGGYNTANSFRFFSGDTVAGVGGVTSANLFTNSYIVNVGGDQAAGVYTSTMTYICTATF